MGRLYNVAEGCARSLTKRLSNFSGSDHTLTHHMQVDTGYVEQYIGYKNKPKTHICVKIDVREN
jgi:hypothetical protein